jgi:hypothetical protein
MARSYGANATFAGKLEATYGTPPGGDYESLPFISTSLGSEQGLIASDVLGQGRDPAAPIRDVIRVEGDVVVPVDLRSFAFWLRLLLGEPDTSGADDPWTHVFRSGEEDLPSTAVEIGHPKVPAFFLVSGLRANSLSMEFQRSGGASATLALIGQGEQRFAASQAGTPSTRSFTRFHQFQGLIKRDGTPLGNVGAARLTYSNNLEPIEVIRDDGKIDGVDPTVAALTGTIEARFADTALLAAAEEHTALELELAYTIAAGRRIVFTAHEVYLPKPKQAITGPGGVQASFDWQAAKNEAEGVMLTVTLDNDVETW